MSFSPQELDPLWVHRPLLAIFTIYNLLVMSSLIPLDVALCPEMFYDMAAVYLALKIASLRYFLLLFQLHCSIGQIVSLL